MSQIETLLLVTATITSTISFFIVLNQIEFFGLLAMLDTLLVNNMTIMTAMPNKYKPICTSTFAITLNFDATINTATTITSSIAQRP